MKVVTIATDFLPKIGGISNHIHYLNKYLAADGVDCHVLQIVERAGRNSLETTEGDYPVHRLYIADDLADMRKLKYRGRIIQLVRRLVGEPDIIHTHELLTTEYLVDWNTGRWVWTNHTSQFVKMAGGELGGAFKRWVVKRVLRKAAAVICVSEEVRRLTEEFLGRSEGVAVVSHGIETDRFAAIGREDGVKHRSTFGLPGDRLVVLISAQWRKVKGIHLAVDVMNSLQREAPELYDQLWFVFAGSGLGDASYAEEQRQRLAELRNVTLLDTVKYEDMPYLYAACDLVLIPSLYETAGIVALEAMAGGRPVIGPRVGGLQEVLKDGHTGYEFEPGNSEDMMYKLTDAVNEHGSRGSLDLRERARKHVTESCDCKSVAQTVRQIYEKVISENPAR
ncbi:MAG: glycosyltransferase family 4 protein [bacterium]|nr:glycosyltransferase family 4 protein [bacterium]